LSTKIFFGEKVVLKTARIWKWLLR
jgi:hypothetical protein